MEAMSKSIKNRFKSSKTITLKEAMELPTNKQPSIRDLDRYQTANS